MDLKITDVQSALLRLTNHYPEAGHNGTTTSKLAVDWFSLLIEDGVTQAQFVAGMRHAVKTCRFFPKLADVLEGVKNYREKPPAPKKSGCLQIEEHTVNGDNLTKEEIERNMKRIEMVKMVYHPDPEKRVTIEEAVALVESVSHIAEFSTMDTKWKEDA